MSEWNQFSSWLVNRPQYNPPSAEAVLYYWRSACGGPHRSTGWRDYLWRRLSYEQYWGLFVGRVQFCIKEFSCHSVITHEYIIAFADEQLYRQEAWDRYVYWHWEGLHKDGLLDREIPDFKWFLSEEWQIACNLRRRVCQCRRCQKRLKLS